MSNLGLLSGFPIFSSISESHLQEISQQLELHEFNPGETVFLEGDAATHLYGVLSGEVELVLVSEDKVVKTDVQFEEYTHSETKTIKREIVVDLVGEGDVFGWSAMTPAGKFTSKAVCARPTRLFSLPAKSLKTFFTQQPQIGYPFMERLAGIISRRFANRTDKLIEGWVEAFEVNRI